MPNNHRTIKNVTKGVIIRICAFFAQHLFPAQLRMPFYKAMGMKIGKGTKIAASVDIDRSAPNLITIGENVWITSGCQGGNVCYDYREAYDNLLSYPASRLNINEIGNDGITEYPIYTEQHYWWYFVTPMRIYRMVRSKFHKHKNNSIKTSESLNANNNDNRKLTLKSFFRKNIWKLDFSQAEGWQLINATKRILKRKIEGRKEVSITLIGHSKTFFRHNEKELEKYLKWIDSNASLSGWLKFDRGLYSKHNNTAI